jgi:mannosyltransferase OCH1-like enzyme
MVLVQSLKPLLAHTCFLGEESPGTISAGAFGAVPHHPYIQKCLQYYDAHTEVRETIPRILTSIYSDYKNDPSIAVYPPKTFYPFDSNTIHAYKGQNLGGDVYGVHLWDYSWGHPLNKLFKKIGIYRIGKKVTEILGIKKILKKLLGFV